MDAKFQPDIEFISFPEAEISAIANDVHDESPYETDPLAIEHKIKNECEGGANSGGTFDKDCYLKQEFRMDNNSKMKVEPEETACEEVKCTDNSTKQYSVEGIFGCIPEESYKFSEDSGLTKGKYGDQCEDTKYSSQYSYNPTIFQTSDVLKEHYSIFSLTKISGNRNINRGVRGNINLGLEENKEKDRTWNENKIAKKNFSSKDGQKKLKGKVSHTSKYKKMKQIYCNVCQKLFTQSNSLKEHMRIHIGEKPFVCSVCEKPFTRSSDLKKHLHIHTGEKRFSCSVCGKSFTESSSLNVHMRLHTGEKPFSCTVCERTFSNSSHLKVHMLAHTGEKPFSCNFCEKLFTQSSSLTVHVRTHTGEKPFSCTVCEKSFTENGSLKEHMRIHTGDKRFPCTVCGKLFTKSCNLKRHMRIHTGEKPFLCNVCEKSFIQSGSLKAHMRIHTGEKPFSCTICRKSFTESGSLKVHLRTHSRVKL